MINQAVMGEDRLRWYDRRFRIWVAICAVTAAIAIASFAGIVIEHFLKGSPTGGVEINEREVENFVSWLGVKMQDINDIIARQFDLSGANGVLVSQVIDNSPAAEGGIKQGDVITRFDREKVQDTQQLQNLVAETSPGDRVKVVVERDGKTRALYMKMGERANDVSTAASQQTDTWGMTISPKCLLTDELAGQFGIPPDEKGVMVVEVTPGGNAAKAGLQVGDLIQSVNNKPLEGDISEFYSAIGDSRGTVLNVYRRGATFYVTIEADPTAPPPAAIGTPMQFTTQSERLAIATDGNALFDQVSLRFGTAQYFLIVDMATDAVTAIPNTDIDDDTRGFGIAAAQLVARQDVSAVIAGGIGPQAFDTLEIYRIKIYTSSGAAAEALKLYEAGRLRVVAAPTLPGYGYSREVTEIDYALTGGSSETDEQQEGYKGKPPTIPPMGSYDPAMVSGQTTSSILSGSATSATNRVETCVCPLCGTTVIHPAGVPCSHINCPNCGSRLISVDAGMTTTTVDYTFTGGSSETDEQQEGYKGKPPTIPPMGSYDPAMVSGQTTSSILSGSTTSATNRVETCVCPLCGTRVIHPAGIPCSQMTCPDCGSRLINASTTTSSGPATVPPVSRPSNVIGGNSMTTAGQATFPILSSSATSATNRVETCVCPICGTTVIHPAGVPCSQMTCPNCGSRLISVGAGMTTSANMLPATGTQTPYQGTPQRPYYAGAAKGQRDLVPTTAPYSALAQSSASMSVNGNAPIFTQGTSQGGQGGSGGQFGGSSGSGGAGGDCVCPSCGTIVSHTAGVPCYEMKCPRCGTPMVRAIPGVTISDRPDTIPPNDAVGEGFNPSRTPGGMKTEQAAATTGPRIAIASTGPTAQSQVAPLFDRASYYLIADLGIGSFEAVANPNVNDTIGVGIQSAQLVVGSGASAIITDSLSSEAMNMLTNLNTTVFAGASGTVNQAINAYVNGQLTPVSENIDGDSHEGKAKEKEKYRESF